MPVSVFVDPVTALPYLLRSWEHTSPFPWRRARSPINYFTYGLVPPWINSQKKRKSVSIPNLRNLWVFGLMPSIRVPSNLSFESPNLANLTPKNPTPQSILSCIPCLWLNQLVHIPASFTERGDIQIPLPQNRILILLLRLIPILLRLWTQFPNIDIVISPSPIREYPLLVRLILSFEEKRVLSFSA